MSKKSIDTFSYSQDELRVIRNKYRQILRYSDVTDPEKKRKIRKAFNFALDAHKGMRRRSGEPYILHPLEVALITTKDIGLKTTSIVSALLHDVVEDTDYTIKDIEVMFGKKVSRIVDGLTKISGLFSQSESLQAENFRKILLTLADDVRVILIKLSDRLHNMRTLESMPKEKQLKISSETSILYAPLAHRLGLYGIKDELDDLVLKYKNPDAYRIISEKLESSQINRTKFFTSFISPIKKSLNGEGLKYKMLQRNKSISSIWNKMQTKKVAFEQVYDIFAVRIILDSGIKEEKLDCWKTYSAITNIYFPKHDRFRDWISFPKANGYEALHTTVMSKSGKWVEVQIRSTRMDEIAEKGYAAHWKYKGKIKGQSTTRLGKTEGGLDDWLTKIRELLQNPDSDALDFLDDFKLNLFSDEIYVFTPKGEIRTMPKKSKVIDFAYSIHTDIGNTSIGAKINNQLVPLNHTLKSGDQVEILTSSKQTPKEAWMQWAYTARAKSQIKNYFKAKRKSIILEGEIILEDLCKEFSIEYNKSFLDSYIKFIGVQNENELLYRTGLKQFNRDDVQNYLKFKKDQSSWKKYLNPFAMLGKSNQEKDLSLEIREKLEKKSNILLLSKKYDNSEISIAKCCNPIPGDDVIGFIDKDENISIHRTTCSNAAELMSRYGNNIVKTKWREKGTLQVLTGIKMYGNDKFGLIKEIISIITDELGINIRSFSINTDNDLFDGEAILYVTSIEHLNHVIKQLQKVEGMSKVYRID